MDNLPRIRKLSQFFHALMTVLLVAIPFYYVIYWALINELPETLITVNMAPVPLTPHPLSVQFRLIGFVASLFPLSALMYGLVNIRRLFSFFREGLIFSFRHVGLFKRTSVALVLWVLSSIFYESAKSVLFSMGNPPGHRLVSVDMNLQEVTMLLVASIIFVVAWVMDEGRALAEEQRLTV